MTCYLCTLLLVMQAPGFHIEDRCLPAAKRGQPNQAAVRCHIINTLSQKQVDWLEHAQRWTPESA